MRTAILQSNYIPWKGYFDIIGMVDVFVLYDDVQFTKNDWRNRNKIKQPNGPAWISIPCGKDKNRLICEVRVDEKPWREKHWKSLVNCYSNAPYWETYKDFLESFYETDWKFLSDLNHHFIKWASTEVFGFDTKFIDSRELNLTKRRGERVLECLEKVGATSYLSGPAGKAYLEESDFTERGMALEWMSYEGYPEYPQLFPPFAHEVSVIDLFVNVGPEASAYLKRDPATA